MASPGKHARDTGAVAPAFEALTVKVESKGETHKWRTAEQDGWYQTTNASLGHRGLDSLQGGGEIWVGSCKGCEWGVEIFQLKRQSSEKSWHGWGNEKAIQQDHRVTGDNTAYALHIRVAQMVNHHLPGWE